MDEGIPIRIEEMKREAAEEKPVHLGDSIVYIHLVQRVCMVREYLGKIGIADYALLEAEEEEHIMRLVARDIITQEQGQGLYDLLHVPMRRVQLTLFASDTQPSEVPQPVRRASSV